MASGRARLSQESGSGCQSAAADSFPSLDSREGIGSVSYAGRVVILGSLNKTRSTPLRVRSSKFISARSTNARPSAITPISAIGLTESSWAWGLKGIRSQPGAWDPSSEHPKRRLHARFVEYSKLDALCEPGPNSQVARRHNGCNGTKQYPKSRPFSFTANPSGWLISMHQALSECHASDKVPNSRPNFPLICAAFSDTDFAKEKRAVQSTGYQS